MRIALNLQNGGMTNQNYLLIKNLNEDLYNKITIGTIVTFEFTFSHNDEVINCVYLVSDVRIFPEEQNHYSAVFDKLIKSSNECPDQIKTIHVSDFVAENPNIKSAKIINYSSMITLN